MGRDFNFFERREQQKQKFLDNPVHNILELCKVLVEVPFTTKGCIYQTGI